MDATKYIDTLGPSDKVQTGFGYMTVAEAAKLAAGNWMEFDSFAWFGQSNYLYPEDIFHHTFETRDSNEMEASNAQAIREILAPYIEDGSVVEEEHSHWAVGYVNTLMIKVYERVIDGDQERDGVQYYDGDPIPEDWEPASYAHEYRPHRRPPEDGTRRGNITPAFLTFCAIMDALDDYPLLDEDDYYRRLEESGIWNVKDALHCLANAYGDQVDASNLPDGWEYEVYHYIQEDGQHEEDYYPSEEEMFEAFLHFGWINPEYLDQQQRMEYEVNKLVAHWQQNHAEMQQHMLPGIEGDIYDLARATLAGTVWEQKELD